MFFNMKKNSIINAAVNYAASKNISVNIKDVQVIKTDVNSVVESI